MSPPAPVPPPVPANARLILSDSNAKAGSEVLISAYAKSEDVGAAIGSFTARLLYDTLQLRLIEADSVNDDAMRALNPVPGEYRIAGASARGIRDGLLFRMRARVVDPRALRRIGLVIDELHSTRFTELTKALDVNDGLDALLSSTPGLHVVRKPERNP